MAHIITYFSQKFATNPSLAAMSESFEAITEQTQPQDRAHYELWKQSSAKRTIVEWLYEQYLRHCRAPKRTHEGLDFLRSGASKGFRLHPALTNFSDQTAFYLWTYLYDCLVRSGYKSTLSDTRVYNRDNYWQETVHRHVLRPANESDWQATHFAEIRLEALYKDSHLCYVELQATIPMSEVPRSSHDFAEMMETFLH